MLRLWRPSSRHAAIHASTHCSCDRHVTQITVLMRLLVMQEQPKSLANTRQLCLEVYGPKSCSPAVMLAYAGSQRFSVLCLIASNLRIMSACIPQEQPDRRQPSARLTDAPDQQQQVLEP